jgi:hypothetical protein
VAFGLNPKGFDSIPDEHWLQKPPAVWEKDAKTLELQRQVTKRLSCWHQLWEIARESLSHAQGQSAKWYNGKRLDKHYAEGEEVLLRLKNLATQRPSKKFDACYLGPFRIAKKIGKQAYRLDLPQSMSRVHPVFNVALLEPWREPLHAKGFQLGPEPELGDKDVFPCD